MKPLTLYAHEILRLQRAGGVTLWRPIRSRTYGEIGATTWVREMWRPSPEGVPYGIEYKEENLLRWFDGTDARVEALARQLSRNGRWRSPVTMPRWASRYNVTIQDKITALVPYLDDGDGLVAGFDDPSRWQNPRDDLMEWYDKTYGGKTHSSIMCWGIAVNLAERADPNVT